MTGQIPTPPRETALLPASTTVGPVHITVADLGRSVAFYEHAVGLETLRTGDGQATVGIGDTELVVLVESPGAQPAHGVSGLYHFALLLPERTDLARWLVHAAQDRVRLTGLSDHYVSEAIYLDDPDGHGIEIYADRPRVLWEGRTADLVVVEPLDAGALVATLGPQPPMTYAGMPAGTRMGHIHLRVASMPESRVFYEDVLGFEVMGALGSQAAFFGAGGYHHHIGVNVWASAGSRPATDGTATLIKATILIEDDAARDGVVRRLEAAGVPVENSADGVLVRDPSGLRLEVRVGA